MPVAFIVLLVLVQAVERAAAGADHATDGRAGPGALAAPGDGTAGCRPSGPDRARTTNVVTTAVTTTSAMPSVASFQGFPKPSIAPPLASGRCSRVRGGSELQKVRHDGRRAASAANSRGYLVFLR